MKDRTVLADSGEEPGSSLLNREWAYYLDNRDEIVRQYLGRYVVIAGNKVVAAYTDESEAYFQTVRDIPPGSFMIHR